MSDIDIGISDIGSSYEKYFFIMNFILLEIDSRCPLGSVFSKISQPLTFFFPYGSERSFFKCEDTVLKAGHNYGYQRIRICRCRECASGNPLKCSLKMFCGEWKGRKARGTAGSNNPVDFPKKKNRNEKYIKEQIATTAAMFDEVKTYTTEF